MIILDIRIEYNKKNIKFTEVYSARSTFNADFAELLFIM